MEITTYKERYEQPTQTISVPEALQEKGFEVYFMPLSIGKKNMQSDKKPEKVLDIEVQKGAGDIMRGYFADVPLPNSPDEDFIVPDRKVYKPLEIK